MIYKQLGNTSLKVSEISIGTEHLGRYSQKRIHSVMNHAVELGFNYFDILTGSEKQREKFGGAIKDIRKQMLVAGHFYSRTRDTIESEKLFNSFLKLLQTDYVDVLFIQFVDKEDDYDRIINDGLYELAKRYQEKGIARYIGISGHKTGVAIKAAKSGLFDVMMHPVNLATHAISTPFRRGFAQGDKRDELLVTCKQNNVGLLAIKPFWGGKLLKPDQAYSATPAQCIHYCLSQIGVDAVVAGVESTREVDELFAYHEKSNAEKDYSAILAAQDTENNLISECVYCNHCLPCPVSIDIALMMKFHDEAKFESSPELRRAYSSINPNAADCIECGECADRCPFQIDVVEKMRETTELFQ